MKSERILSVFGRMAPEEGTLAGYGLIIRHFGLSVPVPERLALIVKMRGRIEQGEWLLFGETYAPEDDLYAQLVFALKYEGVDLSVFRALFQSVSADDVSELVRREPTGQYARRIWFLCEWLTGTILDIPDITTRDYYDLLDPKLQYPGPVRKSRRHGIRNNLPGTVRFCPLIRRTSRLDEMIGMHLSTRVRETIGGVGSDLLLRAGAFLLLDDSRASYAIEGERPTHGRMQRWAAAIGQAGRSPLSRAEFERLQQIVLDKPRFALGYRMEEGFVGGRDARTLDPVPHHISARSKDVEALMEGLIETARLLEDPSVDAVIASAVIAFGFVFIHPFVDGNGRLHRWLIHHMLAVKGFAEAGIVFPVSAVILDRITEYRRILEQHSIPRLALIEWTPARDHNVRIHNETIDLYRYYDATRIAEFLSDCVLHTVDVTLPDEIDYLRKHDSMKTWLDAHYELSDSMATLLIAFLTQGEGALSKRARGKEFASLTEDEIGEIENAYRGIFRKQ